MPRASDHVSISRNKPRTPDLALQELLDGNARFVERRPNNRDHLADVSETAGGQKSFAAVLSCIVSRIPAELVFDQGVGDIFSARVAGNVVNGDVLGSLEFATQVAGSCLIMVLGHTRCGAVGGACKGVKLGKLTGLLDRIQPAVDKAGGVADPEAVDPGFADKVSELNVAVSIEELRSRSEVIAKLEREGTIRIVGAMYDVADGRVTVVGDA